MSARARQGRWEGGMIARSMIRFFCLTYRLLGGYWHYAESEWRNRPCFVSLVRTVGRL